MSFDKHKHSARCTLGLTQLAAQMDQQDNDNSRAGGGPAVGPAVNRLPIHEVSDYTDWCSYSLLSSYLSIYLSMSIYVYLCLQDPSSEAPAYQSVSSLLIRLASSLYLCLARSAHTLCFLSIVFSSAVFTAFCCLHCLLLSSLPLLHSVRVFRGSPCAA